MADTVTFDEPEGFVPPEKLDSDDTFQAMATFKVLGNGELQLIDIDGYALESEEPGEGEGEETEAGVAAGAPTPTGGGQPPGNQSQDRLAAGANQTNTAGYAEQLGQLFRQRMASATKGMRGGGK